MKLYCSAIKITINLLANRSRITLLVFFIFLTQHFQSREKLIVIVIKIKPEKESTYIFYTFAQL
jgi:hypothetical protein